MKTNCPHCSQEYEVEESMSDEQVECQKCNKYFTVVNANQSSKISVQPPKINRQTEKNKGALYGCLICLIVAVIVNLFSNFLFLVWIPLYLATFVLAIVSIAQRRVAVGIFALLASIIAPIIISLINVAVGAVIISESIKENSQKRIAAKSEIIKIKSITKNSTVKQSMPLETQKPKIEGAFGVKFGNIFNVKSAIGTSKLTTGEVMYKINPRKKLRKFSTFYILLTPKSKQIYSIWAYANCKSQEASREFDVIKTLLKNKYKVKSNRRIAFMGKQCSWNIDNCSIFLKADRGFQKSTLELRYTDNKLNDLAKKEHLQMTAESTDDSAL